MRNLLILLFMVFASNSFSAQNVEKRYRDMALPTQKMMEYQTVVNPIVAGTTQVLSANAGATSAAAATVTSFVAQPDVPRNLVITPGGTTGDVESCSIVVTGKSFYNATITETFAFLADASSATTGSKAFKTVTSVLFPAGCESGAYAASWSIGYGEKIGLSHCMDSDQLFKTTLNGTNEATRATVAYDNDEIEKNTLDFNGTMNGSNDFEAFYSQNFRCP